MSSAVVNNTLTAYARGLSVEHAKRNDIAELFAPIVTCGSAAGTYNTFSDKNSMQSLDSRRPNGAAARRLRIEGTQVPFLLEPNAFAATISAYERQLAGGDTNPEGLQMLRQSRINSLVGTQIRSRADTVMTAIKAAVSATGSIGVWSSATNNPIDDIDSQIEAISNAISMEPNFIVFGTSAWRVFKNHPKVLAANDGRAVGLANAGSLFMAENIQVRTAALSKDVNKFGAAKSAVNLVGAEVWIFYKEELPTLDDMSFAKTLRVRGDAVDSVQTYIEHGDVEVLSLNWTEKVIVPSTPSARRITLS